MHDILDAPWPTPHDLRLNVATPFITDFERQFVNAALKESWVGPTSPWVERFESDLSQHLDLSTLTTSNGSVALMLALRALGIGHGDEVIVPALTYAATASSVVNVGADVVFCDVDPDSWVLDPQSVIDSISPKTRAIIAVHLYGIRAPMQVLAQVAEDHSLFIIEDCAEAFPPTASGQHSGSFSSVQTYSFFANKIITTGEGGAVATNDAQLLSRLRLLRGQGMDPGRRYYFLEAGYNFRMGSMPAALGVAQLQRSQELAAVREQCESNYEILLGGVMARPKPLPGEARYPWLYTATLPEPRIFDVANALARIGIETRPVFRPLNVMPAFRDVPCQSATVSEFIAQRGLSLPTGHHVTLELQETIVEVIKKELGK